jgi:transcriptional regulator with XRE-family HTH domain
MSSAAQLHPGRMDMRKLVGRNFARLRRAKGLTQEEVEARSGFSQQYLSSLENGRRNPTVITLFELAQVLGVSHVELVMPDEEEKPRKKGR